jgi:hypothetical protein
MRCSKTRGQIARAHERDAPHGSEREHVVQRAVGRAVGAHAEGLAQVREPMRAQARQADAHDLQRVDPAAAKRMAARDALEERAVEARAVRDDISPADEVDQPRHDALHARLTGKHLRRDPGELGDLEGDWHERIDERLKRVHHLWPTHDRGRDFDDVVAFAVVTGGLDVDDRDLVLEAEQRRPGTLSERLVGRDHVGVGTRDEEAMQGGVSHPPRVADGCDSVGAILP